MLRIGICDDEAGARSALLAMTERILEPMGEALTAYEFSSGEGVLRWLQGHAGTLDLLFLDIEMDGIDGMETARRIREADGRLLLVFVTGYADYVFDGYAVSALDYLMKPVREDKLRETLRRAAGAMQLHAPEVYTFKNTEGLFRIPKEDILYFYSDRRQVVLVTAAREYPFYARLDEVAQDIGEGFVRIHQRYLVRAAAVDRVSGGEAVVGGRALPISRACRQSAMLTLASGLLDGDTI